MKKHLLLLAGACIGVSAAATEPAIVPDVMFQAVSPNGEWTAGPDLFENFVIYHIPTGETTVLEVNEDGVHMISCGNGNFISNTGAFAVTTTYDGPAAVYENGEVTELPLKDANRSSFANGITPDGNRVCGNVGLDMTMDDVIMQTPVIWDRGEDGQWQECVALPYPKLDFTGRVPQYILAQAISADGKTIAGQVRDYSGYFQQPIVWTENEDGEWAYTLPNPELINPDGIVLPEDPGDSPEMPQPTDFMTPEAAAEYDAALMEYWNTWENEPNPLDYMTEAEQVEYTAAKEAYDTAYIEWMDKFDAFYGALNEIIDNAVLFCMNNVYLSPNGRYYASSHQGGTFWEKEEYPVVLDLQTGEAFIKKCDTNLLTTYVNDEGTILATQTLQSMSVSRNAWICKNLESDFIPFNEYVETEDPSVYTWMKENMSHDMLTFDEETFDEVIIPDVWQTGTAFATPDLKTVVSFTQNVWDDFSDYFSFGYILPLNGGTSAAFDKTVGTFSIKTARNGNVLISGAAASLKVYDMNGRMVYSIDNPSAVVSTGLNSGLYIIKATSKDGKVITAKAAI